MYAHSRGELAASTEHVAMAFELHEMNRRVEQLEAEVTMLALAVKRLSGDHPLENEIATIVDKIVNGHVDAHNKRSDRS